MAPLLAQSRHFHEANMQVGVYGLLAHPHTSLLLEERRTTIDHAETVSRGNGAGVFSLLDVEVLLVRFRKCSTLAPSLAEGTKKFLSLGKIILAYQ